MAAYLAAFKPGLRPDEQARLGVYFDDLAMTGVVPADGRRSERRGRADPRLRPGLLRERPIGHHRIVDALPGVERRGLDGRPAGRHRHEDPALQGPHPRGAGRPGPPGRGQPRRHPLRLHRRRRLLRQSRRHRNGARRGRPRPGRLHARRRQREAPARAPLQEGPDRGRHRVPVRPLFLGLPSPRTSSSTADEGGAAVSAAERDQGRGRLRPELPPLVHHRELDRREPPVLPPPGRGGRPRVQGPQGRGDGLYLLPVLRRRGQPLRPGQGADRLPLRAGAGDRPP